MALVKCPECGRENVSDSAEMCPDCGYGIKAHYARIKERERAIKEREYKLSNVKMPEEPKRKNFMLGFGKGCFIFCGIFFVISILLGSFEILGTLIFLGGLGAWFYYEGDKEYNRAMDNYRSAKADFERYKKQEVWKQEQREREEESKPVCPQCGSKNLVRITAMDRSVSIAATGLASGKIGKQYKCKDCKHMW